MKLLWIRVGDNAEYEQVDDVNDAVECLGISNELVRCNTYGVTDNDVYAGLNYISLYYGDEEAEPIEPISDNELAELNKMIANKVVDKLWKLEYIYI
jgi:hypothetical protein